MCDIKFMFFSYAFNIQDWWILRAFEDVGYLWCGTAVTADLLDAVSSQWPISMSFPALFLSSTCLPHVGINKEGEWIAAFFSLFVCRGGNGAQTDWMFKPLLSQQRNSWTCYCMSLTWQQQAFFLLCLCHCFVLSVVLVLGWVQYCMLSF